jgi:hypothetical protein
VGEKRKGKKKKGKETGAEAKETQAGIKITTFIARFLKRAA